MRLTVLGIWGGFPAAGGATSSFLLEDGGFRLLLECGSGVLSQVQRYVSLAGLDAVVVSHYHHDHVADVGCLQYGMLVQRQGAGGRRPLPIYGHQRDKKQFERLTYGKGPVTQGVPLAAGDATEVGPWRLRARETVHGAYCLALRFETAAGKALAYTADTGWCENVVELAAGADVLIAEATLTDEQAGAVSGHLTAGEAGRLARMAGVGRLVLTHFSPGADLERLRRQAEAAFPGPVELAAPGMVLEI